MSVKYLISIFILIQLLLNFAFSSENFYAYHTKAMHSSTDYFGKYADLIVVLGEKRQLEFTRKTQYLPKWITENGSFLIDDFNPQRDLDHNMQYTYVRLLEERPEKIVVHWRYMPDIDLIDQANADLNPAFIEGFTAVVHEIFTIYPDGRIERMIKNALGSKFENWSDADYGDRQTIKLTATGIDHGSVIWGDKSEKRAARVPQNPIKSIKNLEKPMFSWTFDEGGNGFPIEIGDDEESEVAYTVFESETETFCPIAQNINLTIDGKSLPRGKEFRIGNEYDTSGRPKIILWLKYKEYKAVSVNLELLDQ